MYVQKIGIPARCRCSYIAVVALKSPIISVLAQLTGMKNAPVSCANALNYSYLSATEKCANQPRVQTCDAFPPDLRRSATGPATFPAGW